MLQIEERQNKKIPGKSSLFITFPYSKEFVDALKGAITVGDFNKKTKPKKEFAYKKEMYLKQTDRNYKDGDRN